jgi:putative proteasome-type protease
MTYCIALRLDEGLLFLCDTRTNAGVDNVGTYRKLHVIRPSPDRLFVLQSAGNLASTQQVLDRLDMELMSPEGESLATIGGLADAALHVGRHVRAVVAEHAEALGRVGADATTSFIVGGQVANQRPDILLVYPEGNYIRASDEQPFLQIGETKYGKLMLELAVRGRLGMEDATKVAVSSMISTAHANLSVGPPYDLARYRNGSLEIEETRLESDSPLLVEIQERWIAHLLAGVAELPAIPHAGTA